MITSKYYLIKNGNTRLPLNVGGEYFLTGVEGLGSENADTFANLDNGFIRVSKDAVSQQSVVGTIKFVSNAFENYRTLTDWILSAEKIQFCYCPYGSKEYYRDVEFDYLTKGVRDGTGMMQCSISFVALTPWYLPTPVELKFSETTVQYFQYNVTPYGTAPYAASVSADFSAEVSPSGHLPSGFDISYTGILSNPVFTLTGVSGKEYGRCEIAKTTSATDTIKISTDYNDSYVTLIDADGTEEDLLPVTDITKEVFFKMPLTENCTLKIESESTLDGTAEAYVNYYYRSV